MKSHTKYPGNKWKMGHMKVYRSLVHLILPYPQDSKQCSGHGDMKWTFVESNSLLNQTLLSQNTNSKKRRVTSWLKSHIPVINVLKWIDTAMLPMPVKYVHLKI